MIIQAVAGTEHKVRVVSETPEWVSLAIPCDLTKIDEVLRVLEPRGAHLDQRSHDDLCTAVREMLMNAIEHGGRGDPGLSVRLACVLTQDAVIVHIQDPGEGFRRDDLAHAAVGSEDQLGHIEIREQKGIRPGGFGMLMTQSLVDEMIYNEKGNEVLLVKKIR
jgi:anti-sigma regulatory factor (Ser/Thr protein kinase)